MNDKICRLCLQSVSSNNCQTVGESLLKILKLNLKVSDETVMCVECASSLQVFSKFTPGYVYKGRGTLPSSDLQYGVGLVLVKIEAASDLQSLVKCSFCTEAYGTEDVISLNVSNENKLMVNMLEQYILETNLNNTEELLACESCLVALDGVLGVILKYLEVEEKIREYIELEGTDNKGQIQLKEVQKFMLTPKIKLEIESIGMGDLDGSCDHIKEENTTMPELEIKHENEISHQELIIKTDDNIKSEQIDCDMTDAKSAKSDCDGFQEAFIENKRPSMYQCEFCSFQTKWRITLRNHSVTHKSPSEIKMFKCDICSFETKLKSYLKSHLLTHKSPSQINMFKCELCSYEAKYKNALKYHLLTHKSPSEVQMFKCELCPYEAKHKLNLKYHLLSHKGPSELKMFRCDFCSYGTKQICSLKRHLLIHKSPSEIEMFKCELCSYATKRKSHLKLHLLTHKCPSDIKMFKCELCLFETKHKYYLKTHLLTHKSSSEIKMFKCKLCSYASKHKYNVKIHLLTHKSPSEIKMFKCELCSYETKHKSHLKPHLLTHKSPSEIKMIKCELCSYQAKFQCSLNRHLFTHESRL